MSLNTTDTETMITRCKQHVGRKWPHWSEDDRNDIVQEAMVRLCQKTGYVDDPGSPTALACGYCDKVQMEMYRARTRERTWVSLTDVDESSRDFRALQSAAQYEPVDRIAVDGLLNALPDRWRAVVSMKADGFTTREIGQSMGVTQNAVQQTIQRVRRHAARHMPAAD
jgi:RNA polymerase sigma factor (sigma-70 family)